jgi:hypothetical protein
MQSWLKNRVAAVVLCRFLKKRLLGLNGLALLVFVAIMFLRVALSGA